MTSPLSESRISGVYRAGVLVVLLAAACTDPPVAPAEPLAEEVSSATVSREAGSCVKKQMTVEARAWLELSGDLTIEVTSPAGTSIEKVKVKLRDLRGKHAGEFEFNKLAANSGSASVVIPASVGAQPGWTASIKVHVKGCRDEETEMVKRDGVMVMPRFDLSVVPILMAAPVPSQDFPLQDAQTGVPTLYDVTVSNSGLTPVLATCEVSVDGIDVTAGAQYWVDGNGMTIGAPGQPISVPGQGAQVCRFSVTYETEGVHTLAVSTSAIDGGETNLSNNSTTAEITVAPAGNAPLLTFEFVLRQREGVAVAGDGTATSTGIVSQTATIHAYWEQALSDVTGTDTWFFTATSSSSSETFDSRTATVDAQRITRSALAAHVERFGFETPLCQTLSERAPSTTRPYLSNVVTLCAFGLPGEPDNARIRFSYVVNSQTHDPPYNGPDVLVWGPSFSYFAEVQHTDADGTNTFGGVTRTVNLSAPRFELVTETGAPLPGPNVRLTTF